MEYRKHLSEKEKTYDKLCGITLTNIFTLSKNCDTIAFWNVDINNPEHLYVLSVAAGLGGAIDKKISVWGSKFFVWRLNRKLGLKKDCRIERMNTRDTMYGIQPQMLVDDLRDVAKKMCGEDFTFADIYNEFYKIKKGKKQ